MKSVIVIELFQRQFMDFQSLCFPSNFAATLCSAAIFPNPVVPTYNGAIYIRLHDFTDVQQVLYHIRFRFTFTNCHKTTYS